MLTPLTHVRLVRHGEVAAEHQGTYYGGAEVPLSEHGEAESRRLAQHLATHDPPQALFSSPLRRALAVAEPLAAATGLTLQIDAGFRELHRGCWTHLTHGQLEARWPGAIAAYLADPETCNAPDGESESAFSARVWSALDRAVAQHAGQRLVIVTHGHVIRVAMRRVLGWSVTTSLEHFVPYHAIVELALQPDGSGELLAGPETYVPLALRYRAPGRG
jgi:broad specificity phosphatase PhoE